jgi:hypothetical protein
VDAFRASKRADSTLIAGVAAEGADTAMSAGKTSEGAQAALVTVVVAESAEPTALGAAHAPMSAAGKATARR